MEEFYSTKWTQFETQSLAFAILRKSLYPKYLVRGYSGRIVIYKPMQDKFKPQKLLSIDILPSDNKANCGIFKKTDNEIMLVGGDAAYKVLDAVKEYLPE